MSFPLQFLSCPLFFPLYSLLPPTNRGPKHLPRWLLGKPLNHCHWSLWQHVVSGSTCSETVIQSYRSTKRAFTGSPLTGCWCPGPVQSSFKLSSALHPTLPRRIYSWPIAQICHTSLSYNSNATHQKSNSKWWHPKRPAFPTTLAPLLYVVVCAVR